MAGDLDLVPDLEAQVWLILLALSSQVLGWLLITVSLPRLPAVVTSILLTLQPVATVVLAAILLDENPSPLQLVGAATILSGLLIASVGRRAAAPDPAPERHVSNFGAVSVIVRVTVAVPPAGCL